MVNYKLVRCPNFCLNGKVKYYSDETKALYDLTNCSYCNGKGKVNENKAKEIESNI